MSNLAGLRAKLHKFRIRREREQKETTSDQGVESTGNTTDHRSWIKRIEQQGNKADDWLNYTNFLVQNCQGVDIDNANYEYICNVYSRAIKAISHRCGHKCEAYARLFTNYANFVSEKNKDDAHELFYEARTNLKNYAIVHVFAAQFELKQGNIDKCRKIFEKAKEMEVEPKALFETAHMNFLLGYEVFLTEDQITKLSGIPPADTVDSKASPFDISRDSGISVCSNRDNTRDNSVLAHDLSSRTRGGSSSDDSFPISTHLGHHAFPKPLVPKASGSASSMMGLIKPAPAKRELALNMSERPELQESPLPMASGPRSRHSMWNNAFLPEAFSNSEEEGTVSFNTTDKGRKRLGSGGTTSEENDTVPIAFDASASQCPRPLRSSHSTPDCKNPSSLSIVSSRKKRFVGKPRRNLPGVKEDMEEREMDQMDQLSLPIMPDLDVSHTQEYLHGDSRVGNISASTTLNNTTVTSGQSSTLVKTPTSEISQNKENRVPPPTATAPPTADTVITTPSPPQLNNGPPPTVHAEPQPQRPIPMIMEPTKPEHVQQPAPAAPTPAVPMPAAPQTPMHQSTSMLPPNIASTSKQEILVVNNTPYTVLNCIGQGGSSSVFAVLDSEHNLRAVKMVNMAGADEPTVCSYKNEIALLQRLQTSDRVITMYDHEFNARSNMLYVVMERGDIDLATFFSRNKQLNDIKIMYFWQETLEAVKALHEAGIVHTDLKPANFMIVGGHLKLIDFGIAKSIQQDMTSVTTDQQVGTLNFMSPEALMVDSYGTEEDENGQVQRKHKIGYKSDVWSLGCILYRMVYGRTPFQAIRNQLQKMKAIVSPNHEIKFPPIPDAKLHDTIEKCLIRDQRTRPTIDQLLAHPYLNKTKELEPVPQIPANDQTRAMMLKLMEEMSTASPASFSARKQTVQGLLQQLMGPGGGAPTEPAQVVGPQAGKGTSRTSQRTPLGAVNQTQDKC